MDALLLIAVILFAAGAVVGYIQKDWTPGIISAGLFFLTIGDLKIG